MNRADRKKRLFKRRVREFFKENGFYFVVAFFFIAIIVTITIATMANKAKENDWDINRIVEDSIGEYVATIEDEGDDAYILIYGDLDEYGVVEIQNSVAAKHSLKLPAYLMEAETEVNEHIEYFVDGLKIRAEWNENRHDVFKYDNMAGFRPDASAVYDWGIDEDASYVENGVLNIVGYIDGEETNTNIYAQLAGINEMVDDLNVNNSKAEYDTTYIQLVAVGSTYLYHTDYPNLLGTLSVYGSQPSGTQLNQLIESGQLNAHE